MQRRIKTWTEKTMKTEPECGLEQCYRCNAISIQFKRHDRRSRVFLWVVRDVVRRYDSFVIRWKCPICGKILTELPAFALRCKRYVSETVLELTATCLEGDLQVRGGIVTGEDGSTVTYVETTGQDEQYRSEQLWASTVRRWAQWLDGLTETLREAKRLLHSAQAGRINRRWGSSREPYPTARDLLRMDGQFRQIFGHSIFPKFASQQGWR